MKGPGAAGTYNKLTRWAFTLQKPKLLMIDDVDLDREIYDFPYFWPPIWDIRLDIWEQVCTYAVASYEIGNTGNHHVQGYLEVAERQSYQTLQKKLAASGDSGIAKMNFRPANGTAEENRAYCYKPEGSVKADGTHVCLLFEFGEPKVEPRGKAKTNSLANVVEAIRNGATDRELLRDYPSQAFLHFNKIQPVRGAMELIPSRSSAPTVILIYGKSGRGKTTFASMLASYLASPDLPREAAQFVPRPGNRDFFGSRGEHFNSGVYHVPAPRQSGLYWDRYHGEKVVLIDDFDGHYFQPGFYKKLFNSTPFSVAPIGKADIMFNSPYVIITSQKAPWEWWPKAAGQGDELTAIRRRITMSFWFCGCAFRGGAYCPRHGLGKMAERDRAQALEAALPLHHAPEQWYMPRNSGPAVVADQFGYNFEYPDGVYCYSSQL